MMKYLVQTIILFLCSHVLSANEVRILDARVSCEIDCRFSVTLQHADTGWEHYANQWEVLTLDNEVLGTRVLYHPHVDEQPFTRSLSGVPVPKSITRVKIRAKDLKHGYASQEYLLEIPPRP